MKYFLLAAALLTALFLPPAAAELAQPADDIWALASTEVKTEFSKSYDHNNLSINEVFYSSRPYKGKPVDIFGYYVYPKTYFFKLPAILLVHGGGGRASLPGAINLARNGYAVLAIDLPGKGDKRWGSRSGGPDMDVQILLRTGPALSYNYLVNAVAAARNGITFLSRQPQVDPRRIGMVGLSWGGVITLMTNGLDNRLNTAVNVFGAGYIPEGCTWQDWFALKTPEEMTEWNNFIDPKNFLKTQHAPIFFVSGTNDHCYYLPTFQKSYQNVTVPKKFFLAPNLKHQFLPDTENIVIKWLNSKLKYALAFPEVKLDRIFVNSDGRKLLVPVTVSALTDVSRATLYYSVGAPSLWTSRRWTAIKPYYEEGVYYFGIPTALIDPEVMFYVSAADSRGGSVSSLVRSLFKVKLPTGQTTFALSSPIINTYFHAKPLLFVGSTREAQSVGMKFIKQEKLYQIKAEAPELKLSDVPVSP